MSYWKFGSKYAGLTPRGKRFVVNTRAQALTKSGKGKGAGSVKKSSSKKKRKRRSTVARRKKKGKSRGSRILGNMGFKGLITGGVLLFALKYLTRRFLPQAGAYTTGIAAFGAGTIGKATGLGGKSLQGFGAVDAISELVYDLVTPNGMVSLPGVGGSPTSARYDY